MCIRDRTNQDDLIHFDYDFSSDAKENDSELKNKIETLESILREKFFDKFFKLELEKEEEPKKTNILRVENNRTNPEYNNPIHPRPIHPNNFPTRSPYPALNPYIRYGKIFNIF